MWPFKKKMALAIEGKPVHINKPKSVRRMEKRIARLENYIKTNPDAPESYKAELSILKLHLKRSK